MTKKKTGARVSSNKASPKFADLILSRLATEIGDLPITSIDPLSECDYDLEVDIKQHCIQKFWKTNRLPGSLEPLVRAPVPRFYRATSKRKVEFSKGRVSLLFATGRADQGKVAQSKLEPGLHSEIYGVVRGFLSDARSSKTAAALNYVIIRGTERPVVIFNTRSLNGPIVRTLKVAAEKIKRAFDMVNGCFIYVDPTGSPYYLESKRPPQKELGYKKLFGSDGLRIEINGRIIRYRATVFSQVNEPMVPIFVKKVGELLSPPSDSRLLDLYCGYGLFSHCLFDRVAQIVGVDVGGPAVTEAKDNARRLGYQKKAIFLSGRLSASLIEKRLPPSSEKPEVALLDPPRQGLDKGVIQAIAARRPAAVVHIFCGTDRLPVEIPKWQKRGYRAVRAVPLDLFPGTANLETLVLLKPVFR